MAVVCHVSRHLVYFGPPGDAAAPAWWVTIHHLRNLGARPGTGHTLAAAATIGDSLMAKKESLVGTGEQTSLRPKRKNLSPAAPKRAVRFYGATDRLSCTIEYGLARITRHSQDQALPGAARNRQEQTRLLQELRRNLACSNTILVSCMTSMMPS
jgi:hypothetical protein